MKSYRKCLTFVLLVLFSILTLDRAVLAQSDGNKTAPPKPPMAEKKPKTLKIHGTTLVDEYFWLREKSNPQVMDYLRAEDSHRGQD